MYNRVQWGLFQKNDNKSVNSIQILMKLKALVEEDISFQIMANGSI